MTKSIELQQSKIFQIIFCRFFFVLKLLPPQTKHIHLNIVKVPNYEVMQSAVNSVGFVTEMDGKKIRKPFYLPMFHGC